MSADGADADAVRPTDPALEPAHTIAAHEVSHDTAALAGLVRRLSVEVARLALPEPLPGLAHRLAAATAQLERSVAGFLEDPRQLHGLRPGPVRVAEVVQRVIAAHDPEGHVVDHEVASLVVELDGPKFERIIDNLLVNALQHTPAGCRVTVRVTGEPAGRIRVVVEDDGPGLPDEVRRRVFGGERPSVDHGLGIVATLVRLHGGAARAEEGADGRGLRVTVELPTRSDPRACS